MKNYLKILGNLLICVFLFSTVVYAQEIDKISAASIIETTLTELGIEAAKTKLNEICAEREKYAISQSELLKLGSNFQREGKTREAVAVFNIITEFCKAEAFNMKARFILKSISKIDNGRPIQFSSKYITTKMADM